MKRLESWPDHTLTFAWAICMAVITLVHASSGWWLWSFVSLLVTVGIVVIGVRERRRAG